MILLPKVSRKLFVLAAINEIVSYGRVFFGRASENLDDLDGIGNPNNQSVFSEDNEAICRQTRASPVSALKGQETPEARGTTNQKACFDGAIQLKNILRTTLSEHIVSMLASSHSYTVSEKSHRLLQRLRGKVYIEPNKFALNQKSSGWKTDAMFYVNQGLFLTNAQNPLHSAEKPFNPGYVTDFDSWVMETKAAEEKEVISTLLRDLATVLGKAVALYKMMQKEQASQKTPRMGLEQNTEEVIHRLLMEYIGVQKMITIHKLHEIESALTSFKFLSAVIEKSFQAIAKEFRDYTFAKVMKKDMGDIYILKTIEHLKLYTEHNAAQIDENSDIDRMKACLGENVFMKSCNEVLILGGQVSCSKQRVLNDASLSIKEYYLCTCERKFFEAFVSDMYLGYSHLIILMDQVFTACWVELARGVHAPNKSVLRELESHNLNILKHVVLSTNFELLRLKKMGAQLDLANSKGVMRRNRLPNTRLLAD
ncbi:hypothetical protein NEDG_01976 [Nematocida displodere]|uniref:Uncharacterized protein n=1 Tax=Nematocida displodere TaxID=1805483 RepID=A0A177EKD7_9MICR|nr:hypothetical protein NEDG_01976 [Nematocida displodere]